MAKRASGGPKRDVLQEITDKIISDMERGLADPDVWQAPWAKLGMGAARNVVSRKRYRGINALVFAITAEEAGAPALWASFKQWSEQGCRVRKGERSTWGVYWATVKRTDRKTGEPLVDEDGNPLTTMRPVPFNVFHVGQVVDATTVSYRGRIRKVAVDGPAVRKIKARFTPDLPITTGERHDHAVKVLDHAYNRAVHGGDRAYYAPTEDRVHLPIREAFRDDASYVSTFARERTHQSGAKGRLTRTFGKRFGDPDYAAEELVAEMGAAFICQHLGVSAEPRPDHAHYLANWLRALKSDKGALYAAAKDAEAALRHIMADAGQPIEDETTEDEEAAV